VHVGGGGGGARFLEEVEKRGRGGGGRHLVQTSELVLELIQCAGIMLIQET